MKNPLSLFTKKEKILLAVSLISVGLSSALSSQFNVLTLIASLIGVTAVLLCAKGNVWGEVLIAIFSIQYAVISYKYHYYGEMFTYLGMTFPMATVAIATWAKNPSKENDQQVKIHKLTVAQHILLLLSTIVVTIALYFILRHYNTPNLIVSTISIATSFLAAGLTMLRSSYYAFWYAINDLVLIILWIMASIKNPEYIPVVANFGVFFINDIYGFISWKGREKIQGK